MRIVPFLLAAGIALGAIAPGARAADKVLRVVPQADLTGIDPAISFLIGRMHTLMVYETLFALDAKLAPQLMMLEREEVSPDRLIYTFTLRPGLKFHDGSLVTAADVVPSLRRWMVRDAIGQRLAAVTASLDRVDDRTVRLVLKQPYGFVEYSLAASSPLTSVVMRARDVPADPMTPVTEAVGSGPFRFIRSEWQVGSRVVYARNPDYQPRSEPPSGLAGARLVKVDRVEYSVIPDPATAAAALAAGEVDFWDTPALDLVPSLAKRPDITVRRTASLQSVAYLRPNFLFPPFDNVKARQALALSVNQEDYMSAAAGDRRWWQPCTAYLVCGSPYASEAGSENLRTDLGRARALLRESGYKGEKIVLLGTPQLPVINAVAQVAAEGMKAVGFNVELQMLDWTNMVARISNKRPPDQGGYNVFAVFSTGPLFFHPLTNVAINAACDGMNFAGWPCDAETQRLRDEFFAAGDDAARHAGAEALQRRLVDFVPYAIVGQFDQPHAFRKTVRGVLDSNVLVFWNIEKD